MLTGSKKVAEKKAGKFNQAGILASFERQGFTPAKRLLEIVANSIDAIYRVISTVPQYPGRILFEILKDTIKIIDNGSGMDESDAENMWDAFRENNSSYKSRGVSGLGSKPALEGLSCRTEVRIFTRKLGGESICIIIPWDKIYEQMVYTDMITIRPMTSDEQHTFIKERADYDMVHQEAQGTTICIKRNGTLEDLIDDNFTDIMKSNLMNPLDRIDCIFGKESNVIDFCYKKIGKKEPVSLVLYNYFGQDNTKYYTGINTEYIEEYYKKAEQPRFIYTSTSDNKRYEINIHSRKGNVPQYKKKAELASSISGWTLVGRYAITTALLNSKSLFDEENPTPITASKRIDEYSSQFIGDTNNKEGWKYISKLKIVRNNQLIGYCDIPDKDEGSSRGTAKSMFDTLVQTEIAFDPVSTHDNIQDKTIGIQQNKNQFDGKSVPINLLRLVKHIRNIKAEQIWEYFEYIIEGNDTISVNSDVSDTNDTTPTTVSTITTNSSIKKKKVPVVTAAPPVTPVTTTVEPVTPKSNKKKPKVGSAPTMATIQENSDEDRKSSSDKDEILNTENIEPVSDIDSIISDETPIIPTPKNAVFASVILEKIDPFNYYTKQQLLDIINSIDFPSI
jgi:hypothetical protein